jgi:hypothetical protein
MVISDWNMCGYCLRQHHGTVCEKQREAKNSEGENQDDRAGSCSFKRERHRNGSED